MRRFLTCALCFMPTLAGAVTLYYTPGGECTGLYLNPATTGCPGESDRVVKLHVTKRADASFGGFKVGNTEIVDSTGNVKSNAAATLAAAGSAAEVAGDYTCQTGTNKNSSGTCVDESGDTEYIDTAGNPIPPANVSCWRNGTNYCYWRVNITFHDKPTSGAGGITVTNGNDGLKLACNGGSGCTVVSGTCAQQNGAGTCTHINTPAANGYTFRGYYMEPVPNDIITDHSTTNGGAFSVFYPKNLNNAETSILGHAVVVMSDTPVPIENPGAAIETTKPIDIDVYGGWARDCDADANAVCTLKTGIWWNVTDNLGKGDVRYDTGCADGYVISGGAGTYKPICEVEKGEDVSIAYAFKDQWGNSVSCNGPAAMCTLGDTYNLLYSGAVQTACGNDYTLKYWVTDGASGGWHRPGKSISCSTNEFGTARPVPVLGTVCKNICTIGQHYDNLHATCVAVTDGPNLGVAMPQYYNGHYLVDTYNVENLWDGCPTLQCDAGYGLEIDATGPKCVVKTGGDTNFECPTVPKTNLPVNVTLGNPVLSNGTTCTYAVGCNADYLDLIGGNGTITCTGTGCDNLQTMVNAYSCQLHCPESGWAMGDADTGTLTTITYGAPTYDNGICKYNVYCKDSSKTLYHNGTACTSNCRVTCNSYDDCYGEIMAGAPRYTNMQEKFSEWYCTTGGGKGPEELVPAFTVDENLTGQP